MNINLHCKQLKHDNRELSQFIKYKLRTKPYLHFNVTDFSLRSDDGTTDHRRKHMLWKILTCMSTLHVLKVILMLNCVHYNLSKQMMQRRDSQPKLNHIKQAVKLRPKNRFSSFHI